MYYANKELGSWVEKMVSFADVQYFNYADTVGGLEKVKLLENVHTAYKCCQSNSEKIQGHPWQSVIKKP